MPRFGRHKDRPSAEGIRRETFNARRSSIDSACRPPVGAQPTPAAGTTCSTGRGATGSIRMRWPEARREASRALPVAGANGVASGSRST